MGELDKQAMDEKIKAAEKKERKEMRKKQKEMLREFEKACGEGQYKEKKGFFDRVKEFLK